MKNLTLRYSLTQFTFWAAATGAASFATTYLLSFGLSTGTVGSFLAVAGLLSCGVQPALAGIVDRSRKFWLPQILMGLSVACICCFFFLLIPDLPPFFLGFFYVTGIFLSNVMVPLNNALCISYEQAGYSVNYGVARGIGSVASALSSLLLGHVIARLGNRWLLFVLIGFRLLSIGILMGYPKTSKSEPSHRDSSSQRGSFSFLFQYPWYCATLLGVLFLGMYHAMTENYMIAIMERLGGNSSHVGTALFISAMVGAPVIFSIQYIRKVISDVSLLKIAAFSFLMKSILICFSKNIAAIYFSQLLQMTSYAFLEPVQVYYAKSSVSSANLVKGQAFSTAFYAFGCSLGNFFGGQLLVYGVDVMLMTGIFMAAIGTGIVFLTVKRVDE